MLFRTDILQKIFVGCPSSFVLWIRRDLVQGQTELKHSLMRPNSILCGKKVAETFRLSTFRKTKRITGVYKSTELPYDKSVIMFQLTNYFAFPTYEQPKKPTRDLWSPRKYTLLVRNTKIKIKIRQHHSRTRKPRKTNFRKNGDRVPPTSAMAMPLGF